MRKIPIEHVLVIETTYCDITLSRFTSPKFGGKRVTYVAYKIKSDVDINGRYLDVNPIRYNQ